MLMVMTATALLSAQCWSTGLRGAVVMVTALRVANVDDRCGQSLLRLGGHPL